MAGTLSTVLAIAGIAAGAAGVGTSIYEGAENRDAQSAAQQAQQKAVLQQQQAQANQANLSKEEAVLGQQGQAQQQTGGSLTDPGTTALTDLLAGYPGFQSGGTSGTGTSGTTPLATSPAALGGTGSTGAPPDIAAILAALRNGGSGSGSGLGSSGFNLSGGNWQTQPAQPQSSFELANPLV